MSYSDLSPHFVKSIFLEEVGSAGAKRPDVYEYCGIVFARAVLPSFTTDVRPKDKIQGGVALRADEKIVSIHPFVYRLVCRNGAVMTKSLSSMTFALDEPIHGKITDGEIRDAIRLCCKREAFVESSGQIRRAAGHRIDQLMNIVKYLANRTSGAPRSIAESIIDRFIGEEERTAYGLMNAVTSVARDTRHPDMKWRLEELGGGVPALLCPPRRRDGGSLGLRLKRSGRELIQV